MKYLTMTDPKKVFFLLHFTAKQDPIRDESNLVRFGCQTPSSATRRVATSTTSSSTMFTSGAISSLEEYFKFYLIKKGNPHQNRYQPIMFQDIPKRRCAVQYKVSGRRTCMPSSYFPPHPSFFQIGANLLNISTDCSQRMSGYRKDRHAAVLPLTLIIIFQLPETRSPYPAIIFHHLGFNSSFPIMIFHLLGYRSPSPAR